MYIRLIYESLPLGVSVTTVPGSTAICTDTCLHVFVGSSSSSSGGGSSSSSGGGGGSSSSGGGGGGGGGGSNWYIVGVTGTL